uniref:Si:ch211-112f3.4 n=1 Tax=Cyprinus carpio TaxID=7962 RepID=A0A8C1KJV1_CYPCA
MYKKCSVLWMSSVMQVSRIRAARKSEWLKCALAHHFNPESDLCVENEIVVLATGVDQYIQEVFHHLAFYNGDDLVSDDDFSSLCLILGIPASAETENVTSEHRDICDGLPRVLNFREFHARLCGLFSLKAQEGQKGVRLPVSEETEHVEREIRLRCPRVRRRKCVSFDLSADHQNRKRAVRSGQSQNPDHLWQEQLELENASLRELVEDLRSALQSSDARCLALEVALRRRDMPSQNTAETQNCKTNTQQSKHMEWDSRRSTKDLLRELELIRASRDGQLEEAMRFNQRLEEELMAAYGEISRMQEMLDSVRTENTRIKKRTEEVRESLAAGLQGVRALQEQAQQADLLREQAQSLEILLFLLYFSLHKCSLGEQKRLQSTVSSAFLCFTHIVFFHAILLDNLRSCPSDCTPVVQVVDTLCGQLLSSDLLDGGEEVSTGSRPSVTSGHRNTSKPLLMSC